MPRDIEVGTDVDIERGSFHQELLTHREQAVDLLADSEQGDVRRLRGMEDELRLRVGNWRVRFRIDHRPLAYGKQV